MRAGIAVYSILSNDTDVTNIVSTNIFPNVVPQGITANNTITYHVSDGESYDTKDTYNDYHRVGVQVSAFCKDYDTAGDLIEKVRVALERQSGTYGTNTTVTVDNIFFDSFEDLGYLDNVGKYHKVITFNVFMR